MHHKRALQNWTGLAAWSKNETKAGTRLPYERLLPDGTLKLRGGGLLRALQLTGLSFETDDSESLDHYARVRELLLRSSLDARFVLYHHIIRHRVEVATDGVFAAPFAAHVNARWNSQLRNSKLFLNQQFITVLRRPPRGKTGWLEKMGQGLRDEKMADDLRLLHGVVTTLVSGLEPYGARSLSSYMRGTQRCSEILEFLSALYNGEFRPVCEPPPECDIGHYLPYSRVSFGLSALETRGPQGGSYGALLSIKEYPTSTYAGLLDPLLRLPEEFVLTESFAPADRQIARERIDLALRRHKSADADAVTEHAELFAAKDALSTGAISFGDHHLSLLLRAPTLPALDRVSAEAGAVLADIGAVAVREDTNLEPGFWAQFPGNEAYIVRRGLISSAAASGFFSFHGFSAGKAEGNLWGPSAAVFETTSATPYHFNFHKGDLGNFSVIGPSGSGKTVVMGFLAAQAQRFAPKLVFFDKDRGAEILLRALGGHYTRLVPGTPTGLNPLALPDSPGTRAFLRGWLQVLLQASTSEEMAIIAAAVDAAFAHDPAFRRLRYFQELLGGGRRPEEGDLAARLSPFVRDGEHAWLFDNAVDAVGLDQKITGFDMTALLENPTLRTPAMMYLFHCVENRLNGEPAMILIDEGWKALDDAVFAARIRDWLKTLRKRNAILGFATQSARDALDSAISAALVEQTATMLFMPNAKAREEDYCGGFGLSSHELSIIRALPAHSRCFLLRHANNSVVLRLNLSGMPDILTVLSGRETTVRKLDQLRAELGDDPCRWYTALTGTPWPIAESGLQEAAE
ncbi:type IV secretion system protein VirB4 [Rhizomicrobium palustre]|uniref:Type IV secretion system protein virB4 n=1 Tax=Rhizomicrobium palustre TaxID=189966 RepID=A0A846N262_9PROT|nr:VirB4 family type IV secretion/conjugal transfer ATPase [Rhizomicrobium palustre]NIK89826.1 type IV secretion system protein VirB4 [Rhizomicrobium palustre]